MILKAPWSWDAVVALNAYQNLTLVHPYTCGGEDCRNNLYATPEGWVCPSPTCLYTQDWVHAEAQHMETVGKRQITQAKMYGADAQYERHDHARVCLDCDTAQTEIVRAAAEIANRLKLTATGRDAVEGILHACFQKYRTDGEMG